MHDARDRGVAGDQLKPPRNVGPQLVGLFVALGLGFFIVRVASALGYRANTVLTGVVANMVRDWLVTALLLAIVLLWEKQPLTSMTPLVPSGGDLLWVAAYFGISSMLGPPNVLVLVVWWMKRPFRRKSIRSEWRRSALWCVVLLASLLLVSFLMDWFDLGTSPGRPNEASDFIESLPTPTLLALVLTAAVTEEVAYRGYLITRLHALTGSLSVASAVSYILFVGAHVPFFGLSYVLHVTAVGALTFPLLFVHRRNLGACILLHAAFNSMSLIR